MSSYYEDTELTEVRFDLPHRVEGYDGIAWHILDYNKYDDEDTVWTGEPVVDYDNVVAIMVGDNRRHIICIDDIEPIDEDDYCHVCGQIGCGHDGRTA